MQRLERLRVWLWMLVAGIHSATLARCWHCNSAAMDLILATAVSDVACATLAVDTESHFPWSLAQLWSVVAQGHVACPRTARSLRGESVMPLAYE